VRAPADEPDPLTEGRLRYAAPHGRLPVLRNRKP
jgi:hypothetical protein